MSLLKLFGRSRLTKPAQALKARLAVESLETRLVPYSVSGNAWPHPGLVTLSFVPDGSVVGSSGSGNITSNLFSEFNALYGGPEAGQTYAPWQRDILRAAQTWAQQTNINFKVVTDNGTAIGGGANQQGDSGFGDIRIGGYDFGTSTLAQAYLPAPVNNTSFAGDIQLNTGQDYGPGGAYDLYTVALHEIGHALGLYHSTVGAASMFASYGGVLSALNADDIAGIQAVTGYTANGYGSPGYDGDRNDDTYDLNTADNGSFAAATDVAASINTSTKKALIQNLDLTTTADVDYFKFTVPTGFATGTMRVKVQSSNLSVLAPKVTVYASDMTTVKGSANALGDRDGAAPTVTVSNVAAGQTYYVKVEGAESATGSWAAFNTGKYALALGFVGVIPDTAASPVTTTANGNPVSGGGGQAYKYEAEFRVNATTSGVQETYGENPQAAAMDLQGNFVVVWASDGQDGGGYGVYAQRYNAAGVAQGGEILVNTTTANDQKYPAVAMNDAGAFVVTWSSSGQDGAGWGVYAQMFDAAGVKQGGEILVNTTTTGDQMHSVAAVKSGGDFVVAWQSSNDGNGKGIYAQMFNLNGNAQGGEFRVNTYTTNDQQHPAIAMSDGDDLVIAWESDGQDGNGWGVYAQRYKHNGATQGGEFRINTATTDYQQFPAVAMDPDGDFIVTWASKNNGTASWDIYAQRYDGAGVALGANFRVNTTTAGVQEMPAVTMDNEGNSFLVWSSLGQDATSTYGIYAQQYSTTGAKVGVEIAVNTSTAGNQRFPSVAMSSSGNGVVIWSGSGATDSQGIYGQKFKMNASNGLSNLAGVPHGYGPDGCGCDDHGHEGDGHNHDAGDGCGCGTCATAVTRSTLDQNTGYAVLPSATADVDLNGLRRLLANGLPQTSGLPQANGLRQQAGGVTQAARHTQAARRAPRDLLAAADTHDLSSRPV